MPRGTLGAIGPIGSVCGFHGFGAARGWLRPRNGTRALRVTVEGARRFREAFGVAAEIG